jgi:hypothetical protein
MTALRFLGSLLLIVAVVALVSDVTSYQTTRKSPMLTPLGKHWADYSPNTLAGAQRTIARSVHPALWDPVIKSVLPVPTCVLLGGLGLFLVWAGRKRRRVQLFTN